VFRALTGQSVQLSSERSLDGSTVSAAQRAHQPCDYWEVEKGRTWHILVPTKRRNNTCLVRKLDAVLLRRREKALQQSDRRIEDDAALAAVLDARLHLVEVDKVRRDVLDVGRRGGREVPLSQELPKLKRLNLKLSVSICP
jgi:hypothetical protein